MQTKPLISDDGGHKALKSFQIARLVYDVTVRFCNRYVEKNSLTHDLMLQSARSGVENIAEGFRASADSKKTELKLTSEARASLKELRLNYKDFLRHHNLPVWPNDDRRHKTLKYRKFSTVDEVALWVLQEQKRQSSRQPASVFLIMPIDPNPPVHASTPEITANVAISFTVVACKLLDRQIVTLSKNLATE